MDTPDTAIVPAAEHAPVAFIPAQSESDRIWRLASAIADTDFVPKDLRGNTPAILAAMLTGREIGIGAMHSLRAIDVIDGRPSLSAELMMSLALRAGHDIDVVEASREGATVRVHRAGWPEDRWREIRFDETDARIAGLIDPTCKPATGEHNVRELTRRRRDGSTWKVTACECRQGYVTYPRAMYRSRAVAEACRSYLPDVVERVSYTVSELDPDRHPHPDDVAGPVEGQDVAVDVEAAQDAPDGDDATDVPDDVEDVVDADVERSPTSPADGDGAGWRDYAAALDVSPVTVLRVLRERWPTTDDFRKPNRTRDVDTLVDADPAIAEQVREIVNEVADAGDEA